MRQRQMTPINVSIYLERDNAGRARPATVRMKKIIIRRSCKSGTGIVFRRSPEMVSVAPIEGREKNALGNPTPRWSTVQCEIVLPATDCGTSRASQVRRNAIGCFRGKPAGTAQPLSWRGSSRGLDSKTLPGPEDMKPTPEPRRLYRGTERLDNCKMYRQLPNRGRSRSCLKRWSCSERLRSVHRKK